MKKIIRNWVVRSTKLKIYGKEIYPNYEEAAKAAAAANTRNPLGGWVPAQKDA